VPAEPRPIQRTLTGGDERNGPPDGSVAVPPGALHREVLAGDLVEIDVLQWAAQTGRDDYPATIASAWLMVCRRPPPCQSSGRRLPADDIPHLVGEFIAGNERAMRAGLLRYGKPGRVTLQPADNDLPGTSLLGRDNAGQALLTRAEDGHRVTRADLAVEVCLLVTVADR